MEEDEINVWPMYTIPSVAILAQALEESDERGLFASGTTQQQQAAKTRQTSRREKIVSVNSQDVLHTMRSGQASYSSQDTQSKIGSEPSVYCDEGGAIGKRGPQTVHSNQIYGS